MPDAVNAEGLIGGAKWVGTVPTSDFPVRLFQPCKHFSFDDSN